MVKSKLCFYLVLVFISMLASCGLQEVENYGFDRKFSPDGKSVEIWYFRNAGATTATVTAFSLYRVGADERYALDHPILVINAELSSFPITKWKSLDLLEIELVGIEERKIFIKDTERSGVKIAINPVPGEGAAK